MKRLSFLFFFAVIACISPTEDPAAQAPETVFRQTLDNGLRVVVVPNKLAPVVTTEINYLAGSNEAPAGFPGMAHALEHMMFRGNKTLSAAQLATISAGMGGEFNADTQQNVTQYFFTAPSNYLPIALNIEANRMANIFAEDDLWTKERGAIEQEVARDLSSPEYVMYTRLLEAMFAGTPYAHDALGTRESFDKTTGLMLQNFHNEWYAPNNAILVIVGDVDPAKAVDEVKRLFGNIPKRPLPSRASFTLQPMKPASIELDSDLPYGLSVVAYRLPGYDSPDYAAGQVLADVLGSQRAEIYGLAPAGKALEAEFESASLPIASIGYAAAAFPPNGKGAELISELKRIIGDYKKNGLPPGLVEASKRHEVSDAEFQKNSISGLAQAWSEAVAVQKRSSPDELVRQIQKVTVADVNRVAKEYLDNETAVTAILTPRPSGKAVTSKGYGGGESFAPAQVKPVQLPDWAKQVRETPTIPATNLTPTVSVLPNGLRLIVQPESISPTVNVFGKIKNNPDLEEPKGQEGVSTVLDSLFSYGTKTLDRLAFRKAIDDIGANETAGASFSLQVLKDHLDRGIELLASNMLDPALPETAFKVVQQETAGLTAGELQSPRFLSELALLKALYPAGDPKQRHATPESVMSLKYADVKNYYAKAFRPDLTTIVVIGQVEPATARQLIEKYFSGWRTVGPKPETDLPPVPKNSASGSVVPDPSRVQDEVVLAQTLGFPRNDPEYYKLQLGNNVLSGAFYATRLYHDLREEAGLVYNISSSISASKTRSTFSVSYACDPPNVGKARALIERDLKQMQATPMTPEELQNARTLLIMQIPLSESAMSKIAAQMLQYSELGLPLDEPVRAAKRYMEITAAQVQEAFAKWLRPADFVQITLGPNPQ